MSRATLSIGLVSVLALAGCAVAPPSGPSVMALPQQGKSFEAFQQDDATCRGWATQQTGGASAAQRQTTPASAVRFSAPRWEPVLVRPSGRWVERSAPERRSAARRACWPAAQSGQATPRPRAPVCSSAMTPRTRSACTRRETRCRALRVPMQPVMGRVWLSGGLPLSVCLWPGSGGRRRLGLGWRRLARRLAPLVKLRVPVPTAPGCRPSPRPARSCAAGQVRRCLLMKKM